jgi:MFS family permease
MGEIIGAVNGSTFVANHSPASHRGRISSIVNFISGTGRTFAPLIMGYIISGTNMMIGWFVIAGAVCFGAIMMFLLKRMKARMEKREEPVFEEPPENPATDIT